jgi:hypothetical protein
MGFRMREKHADTQTGRFPAGGPAGDKSRECRLGHQAKSLEICNRPIRPGPSSQLAIRRLLYTSGYVRYMYCIYVCIYIYIYILNITFTYFRIFPIFPIFPDTPYSVQVHEWLPAWPDRISPTKRRPLGTTRDDDLRVLARRYSHYGYRG